MNGTHTHVYVYVVHIQSLLCATEGCW